MSRRPVGPSERTLYYYDDPEGDVAPRLPTQSVASRLLLGGVLVCCCGLLGFSLLLVASLFATLPRVVAQPAPGPGGAVVSINAHAAESAPALPLARVPPPRSVLQRLAMLKRAPAPARGVDRSGARAVFPHWFKNDDEWDVPTALDDVVLALSYIAHDQSAHSTVKYS